MNPDDSFIIYNLTTPRLREQVQRALFQLGFEWCAQGYDNREVEQDDEMFYISSSRRNRKFIFYGHEDGFRKENLKNYDHAMSGRYFLSKLKLHLCKKYSKFRTKQ